MTMTVFLLIAQLIGWLLLLVLGFLLLGTLRALGRLTWRLDQMDAISPRRIGRDGLSVGVKAPDFRLISTAGREVALSDFAGKRVLLVLVQSGCGPRGDIVPELNRLTHRGKYQLIAVDNGTQDETRAWAARRGARFLVLTQEQFSLSKRFQVFATPFAFVIDEQGTILSKGIVGSRQYLGYVLTGATNRIEPHDSEAEGTSNGEPEKPISSKEVTHV
jgi:methylamine dehydrogenase accessory protein MauD